MENSIIQLKNAALAFGERALWRRMNLEIAPGEFVAILGPNGSGKSSFLRVLLGLENLSEGDITVFGREPRRGNPDIGYIPQQRSFDVDIPIRGRDLVEFGVNGQKWGLTGLHSDTKRQVDEIIKLLEATAYADRPLGKLSGGEQQRLRIAQALIGRPQLLLCDEPLLSLDLKNQEAVSSIINNYRLQSRATVLFVTHDINSILSIVDRVIYIARGKWSIGSPQEVLTNKTLSDLYGSNVKVYNEDGRIFIVGCEDSVIDNEGHHHAVHINH